MRKYTHDGPPKTRYPELKQATPSNTAYNRRQRKIKRNLIMASLLFVAGVVSSWVGSYYTGMAILCLMLWPLCRAAELQTEQDLRKVK